MSVDEGLIAWVTEALEPVGPVTLRKMMGGATLYCGGTIFAIVADDQLWFKADKDSDALWDEAECPRFTYTMGEGRTGSMNYRRAPEDVYDDAEAMRDWAAPAIAAGQRQPPARKSAKARKKT